MKYEVGDKVVLGDLKNSGVPTMYAHKTGTIANVDSDGYRIVFESGDSCYIFKKRIDYEATARLNNKSEITISTSEIQTYDSLSELRISMEQLKQTLGGETMNANEILEKWRNKKADELISQQDEEIKKVTKEDEIQKLLEEHEREINKIIKDKYKIDTEVTKIFCTITTRKTGDKIEAINKEFDKKVAELDEKEEEIKAVLKVAENQDKVFEILNKQGIIDKNYNIL